MVRRRLLSSAWALLLIVVCLSGMSRAATAAAEVARAVPAIELSTTQIWPHASDDRGPRRVTITVTVPQDYPQANYLVHLSGSGVARGPGTTDLGTLRPGDSATFTWDGTDRRGTVQPGTYLLAFQYRDSPTEGAYDVASRRITVLRDTGIAQVYEERSDAPRHLDLTQVVLERGRRSVTASATFRRPIGADLNRVVAYLDTDRELGYIVQAAKKRGVWRTTVLRAHIGTDVGRPLKVRCPGAGIARAGARVTLTLPTACMFANERRARVLFEVGDRHGHYDSGPDDGSYYSGWARYVWHRRW